MVLSMGDDMFVVKLGEHAILTAYHVQYEIHIKLILSYNISNISSMYICIIITLM